MLHLGNLVYANPAWFAISGHDPELPLSEWKNDFVPEDLPRVERLWQSVVVAGQSVDVPDRQFRFKTGKWAQLEVNRILLPFPGFQRS
jgi:PAS domain-containing protein